MYQFEDPSVQVDYFSAGSGWGKSNVFAGNIAWGGSDAPLSSTESTNNPDIILFPVVAGALTR